MTMLHHARKITAATALLVVMAAGNTASAAEKLVGTYGEERTVLAFKVPDTAAQKLLPEGWQVSAPRTGPSKDANLNVVYAFGAKETAVRSRRTSGKTGTDRRAGHSIEEWARLPPGFYMSFIV
jgi:hypothetical protein